ncbi:MAG: hypothetical protein LBT81_04820 [Helicobacteraceae bacterium]|jgi:hypothetical protein|nr:hypothetical protein [Helicobacteraceae bacterium]
MKRKFIFPVISVCLGALIALVMLEIFLRFFPVGESLFFQSVNEENPVFRAEPDRSGWYSKNWNFKHAARWRSNNDGFINDRDYKTPIERETESTGLIAVIGDSYVEALIVPPRESFFERLEKEMEGRQLVYSFGFSGAPLSQYLIWARYAQETYKNDYLIVLVIGNDFDESLLEYKSAEGGHYYEKSEGGLKLKRVDFTPSIMGRVARRFFIFQYTAHNIQLLLPPPPPPIFPRKTIRG